MPDRLSLMLDSMILAVDEGHSYDGVVSIPDTGLEDVTYRSGLVGLLGNGLELVREAISRLPVISRFLVKRSLPTRTQPETSKRTSVADSKIGHGETKPPSVPTPSPVTPGPPPSPGCRDTDNSPSRESGSHTRQSSTSENEGIRPEPLSGPGDPRKRIQEGIPAVGCGVGHVPEQGLGSEFEDEFTGTGLPGIRNVEDADKERHPRRKM